MTYVAGQGAQGPGRLMTLKRGQNLRCALCPMISLDLSFDLTPGKGYWAELAEQHGIKHRPVQISISE
jgi:hypothetical protein